MMKLKRTTAIFLSVILLLGAVAPSTSATDPAAVSKPSAAVTALEKTCGMLGSLLGRLLKLITFTDESRIRKADKRDAAGTASGTALFSGAAEQTLTAETWRAVELMFESDKAYADPFNDVTLDLLLYGNGRLYTIPGFWDGGNTWRARFVCPAAGTWQCKTVCSDETNAALHGRTATVSCTAYSGDLAVYQHGFVTTRYGEKYLTYEDGTPFFYFGDTHWSLGDETADMVSVICEKRVSQGFTVFQSQPIGAKFNLADGVDEGDMAGLTEYDRKFQTIADAGLVHANSEFFWPTGMIELVGRYGGYNEDGSVSDGVKTYCEALSRYWVARYSAYPVIWTLGQEVDRTMYGRFSADTNPYKLVAEYLGKYDPYSHPLTAHQENTGVTVAYGNGNGTGERLPKYHPGPAPSIFRDVPAHTMYAMQWGPDLTKRDDYMAAKDFWYNGQGKPTVYYEGRYCYLWTKNFGARMQGWAAFLNGTYGCSWGGQDTWSYTNIFDENTDSDDGVDITTSEEKTNATWQDALEYPSAYQLGYMRSFLEQTEWYNLIPRFDNWAYFVPASDVYSYYASNKNNTEIVVYFYSFTDESVALRVNTKKNGGVLTGTVGSLTPFAEYAYRWFDPISGEYIAEGTFTASGLGTWFAGIRPAATDLALLIEKI